MGYTGQRPSAIPLTTADIVDGTISNADLAGSITSAKITSLDATKLTGTIADARISASSVNAHVDLTAVRQDIATLALYNAVSDNRSAYNLPSSFIDQFEDDTGITTETTVDRNASEYVSSATESFGTPAWDTGNRSSSITSTTNVTIVSGSFGQMVDGDVASNQMDWNTTTATPGKYLRWQWAEQKRITGFRHIIHSASSASPQYMGTWQFQGSNNGNDWVDIGSPFILRGATTTQDYTEMSGNNAGYTYYQLENTVQPHANGNPYHKEMEFLVADASSTVNATGTLISDAQTAPTATTKMSGVILYKDNAGTATLGTDLVVSLSANNGTNWTDITASNQYEVMTPVFSTGIKMVRVKEQTVTSGTAPVIKAVWANQAATVAGSSPAYVTGDRSSTITVSTNMTLGAGTVPTLVEGTLSTLAANAFYWNNHTPASGAYIQFAFSTATICSEAYWYQDVVAVTHGTWQWQGSNTAGGASGYSNIGSTFTLGGGGTLGVPHTGWARTQLTQLNGNTTAYLYYRLAWQSGAVSIGSWNGEVEFKQGATVAAVTGKETQLHGWAMNY